MEDKKYTTEEKLEIANSIIDALVSNKMKQDFRENKKQDTSIGLPYTQDATEHWFTIHINGAVEISREDINKWYNSNTVGATYGIGLKLDLTELQHSYMRYRFRATKKKGEK